MPSKAFFVSLALIVVGILLLLGREYVYFLGQPLSFWGIRIFALGLLILAVEQFLRLLSEIRIFHNK